MRFSAKEFVQRPVTAKPRIERLEDRLAPADITYVGPTGGDWGVAANWSTGTVPTFSDEVIFNSQSNSCIAKNAIISSAACARLVNRGFIRSLTFQVPLTISGFLAATDADSNWSGGQLNQVNVGTSIASITLNGGEFQWTGGTWNAPPSTINDVYLTGGAQLDMYKGATNFGSNIWIGGTTNSNGTLRIGSGDSNALTGNVTMSNGADISIAAQSPEGNLSNLLFAQGATSSATVGGLATTTSQSITNYGTITRDSPSNAAVLCGLGIGQSQGGTVQLTNQSKLNITGRYGAGGNSLQQNGPSITQLGVSSLLGVTYGYYQSGGQLRTNTNPVAGSSVTATIDGWATIVGGQVSPGYDGTELLKNIATLNFTGSTGPLTIGGNAELDFNVDGSSNGRCDQIDCGTSITINANPAQGDHAYVVVTTWVQKPPQGQTYGILFAIGNIAGNAFDATKNQFFGYGAAYNISPIPGFNPVTLTEQ